MPDRATDIQLLVDEYLAAHKDTREGHHKAMLLRFVTFSTTNGISSCQVTVKDIELFIEYLHQAGYASDYIAVNFVFLRRFFDHLQSLGLIQGNPARDAFARAGRAEPRRFTDEELLRVHHEHHPRA